MGMKEVPTIMLSHLSKQQKKAYILTHNKLTMNTGFEQELLLSELSSLFESGFDLGLTGFDESEIVDLGVGIEVKEIDYDRADDVYTVKQKRVTQEQ